MIPKKTQERINKQFKEKGLMTEVNVANMFFNGGIPEVDLVDEALDEEIKKYEKNSYAKL